MLAFEEMPCFADPSVVDIAEMCVLISGLGGVILFIVVNPPPMLAIPDPILPLREDD